MEHHSGPGLARRGAAGLENTRGRRGRRARRATMGRVVALLQPIATQLEYRIKSISARQEYEGAEQRCEQRAAAKYRVHKFSISLSTKKLALVMFYRHCTR